MPCADPRVEVPLYRRTANPLTRRVLLIGATGAFGTRLASMLARMDGVDLVLAARGRAELLALSRTLVRDGARASILVEVFDRRHPEALASLRPWIVIDAAGPFQDTGYDLPMSAIRAGAHYIDISDARAFVARFPEMLNAEAREAGVLTVCGQVPRRRFPTRRLIT